MEPAEVNDDEEDGQITVYLVHRSLNRYEQTMYVNLYEDHFSYVFNLKRYSKSYQCRRCANSGKFFESIEQKLEAEEEEEEEEGEEEEEETPRHQISSPLQKLYKKLEGYLTQLPVVGFNSGKYACPRQRIEVHH